MSRRLLIAFSDVRKGKMARLWLAALALALLAALLALPQGRGAAAAQPAAGGGMRLAAAAEVDTPTPTLTTTPTHTPIPADYLETDFQASGLMIGGVLLVIIIVGGTLFAIRRGQK